MLRIVLFQATPHRTESGVSIAMVMVGRTPTRIGIRVLVLMLSQKTPANTVISMATASVTTLTTTWMGTVHWTQWMFGQRTLAFGPTLTAMVTLTKVCTV